MGAAVVCLRLRSRQQRTPTRTPIRTRGLPWLPWSVPRWREQIRDLSNCSSKPAAHWLYQQSTLNRINYDNVNSDNIWNLADGGEILANNWT